MGDIAAQWFSDFLSEPGSRRSCAWCASIPSSSACPSRKWTGGIEAPNQFADGFPLLVASEGSLAELNARLAAAGHAAVGIERFRPNIVLAGIEAHDEDRVDTLHIATGEGEVQLRPVKPCARCPIPDIDPATADEQPRGRRHAAHLPRRSARRRRHHLRHERDRAARASSTRCGCGQPVGANLRFE